MAQERLQLPFERRRGPLASQARKVDSCRFDARRLTGKLQDDKEQLEDLNMELELADEDEPVLYKIASSFYHLKPEQATEKVQKSLEALGSEINSLEDEASQCKEKMDGLKAVLYAKFGSRLFCPSWGKSAEADLELLQVQSIWKGTSKL